MRIPADDAAIAREKLTEYLLVPQVKNDKSRFLAQAGFTQDNPDMLEAAIRTVITENGAVQARENDYGAFSHVSGDLKGPDGALAVVTVWILAAQDDTYRFITLKPDKE